MTLTLGFFLLGCHLGPSEWHIYGAFRDWLADHAHINHLKRKRLILVSVCQEKNIIYGNNNNIMSNRNELVRRLLSGITMSELQNLVYTREEANRPIPAPRIRGREARPIPAPRRMTPIPTPRRNVQQLVNP